MTRAPRPVRGGPSSAAALSAAAEGGYGPGEPGTLRSGDLVLDGSRWTVHRAGTPVRLSPTEFRLLACLMRHQGTVLTRTQLLRSVWGRDYTGQPQVVETYVSYLRRKLGRLGPPVIHTHRGIGYVLRPPDAQERHREPAGEHGLREGCQGVVPRGQHERALAALPRYPGRAGAGPVRPAR